MIVFEQCQTMSSYNCKVQFFLNFPSASVLRPDLSGNPFWATEFAKSRPKKIGNGRHKRNKSE